MTTSGGLPRRRPAAPDTEQHKPAPKAHAKTTYKMRRWMGK